MTVKEFCKKYKTELILGGVVTVVVIGCALYTRSKINGMQKLINGAVDEVSGVIKVDVSQTIVDQAISRAVDREVGKAAKTATLIVSDRLNFDIRAEVKSVVLSSATDIRKSVSDQIAKQVGHLDIDRLKYEVAEKAKEMTVEKLDRNMDALLDDFNKNLSNVSKIYNSTAESMTPKKAAETVIKVG